MTILAVGTKLPGFTLDNQFGESVRSSTLLGSRVLMVFYPFAFSPTCGSEWLELKERAEIFAEAGVRVLGVSVDSKYALRAYAEAAELPFELLSDFWPHGEVAKNFGVFDEARGMAERGSFAFDESGELRDSFISSTGAARPWASYQAALNALTSS